MKRKRAAIILAVLSIVGWFVYQQFEENATRNEVEDLARAERLRKQRQQSVPATDPVAAFEALAKRGKGQPLPESLETERDERGFWFVGRRGSDVGVEIPFAPGRLPESPPELEPVNENPGFLGAQACQSCHPKTFASFKETAHHRTSRPASAESISGSLEPGKNRMQTYHPNVHFTMLERDGSPFQRVKFFDWHFEVPFHIITGSSKMAETYLYWHSDELYEMNVTYLRSVDDWVNSPGYIDGDAAYARPIPARCLECHTTYADYREPPNHFTPGSVIFGISCERCHGPGRDHVDYHTANPQEKIAKHVTVPSDLPREQELQICSQCHSGVMPLKDKPYQFRPGDDVSDHYLPVDAEAGNSVHTSNQRARMSLSECFIQSEMTCVSCHNPHRHERGDSELFSERCLKCHETAHCGMSERLGDRLAENCIDCHMPNDPGDHLRLDTADGSIFPPLRDHYIRVDAAATQDYLKLLDEGRE